MTALPLIIASACLTAPAPELPHGPTPKVYALIRIVEANVGGHTPERLRSSRVQGLKDRSVLQQLLKRNRLLNLAALKNRVDAEGWLQVNLVAEHVMPEVLRIGINGPPNNDNLELINQLAAAIVSDVLMTYTPERLRALIEGYEYNIREHQEKILTMKEELASPANPLSEDYQELLMQRIASYERIVDKLEHRLELAKSPLREGLPRAEVLKKATSSEN